MIRVVDVFQHYGIRPVLRDFSLEVKTGELVVIMGPNGMGKTTLLQVMAGALSPQKGYVEIDGMRRRSTEEAELAIRRKVVFLPADPWIPDPVLGREFLLSVGKLYDIEEERLMDHADRLLRLFNLEDKGDTPIGSYSTGQKKKIALAAALIAETPILLLDEPFSGGLDPSGILALRKVLKSLAERRDVTIVMTTPVPELVEELAERIAIIQEGRLVAYDTAEGLRKQTGCDGPFEAVLEQLLDPGTAQHVKDYLQNGRV